MANKIDARQSRLTAAQAMIGSAGNDTLDTVFPKINDELAKMFEDRNVTLTDGGLIAYLGTSVQFTQALKLHINSKVAGGSPTIIDLGSTTRTISADGRMIYAVVNRGAGTASVTDDASSLPAVTSANQEVFLIAKRVDSPDGVKRLYFRNGSAFNEGQSARLGSAGSGGSGSGIGDDLGQLTFKASVTDTFSELATDTLTTVDYSSNKTDPATLSIVNQYIRLEYDAAKTVAGGTTTTNLNISANAAFFVKIGDFAIYGSEVRRITAVASQSSFTTEAFSIAPTVAGQITISQGVYTKDLNAYAGDGIAPSTAFSTSINQILLNYEETTTLNDIIFDANTAPAIAYSASSDGSSYSSLAARSTNLSDSVSLTNLPTSGTNLYIRFVANKTSGTGQVNLLNYKVFFHRDLSYSDGTILNQAYAFTDGVGTEINCSAPTVVTGKTRLTVTFTYPVAVNSGTTNGALKVYLNGQKIPRYVDATLTPDASYKEISSNTIELDSDYSALNYSLEVVQDVAVVDSSETNSAAINLINDSKIQNQLMNGAFDLWQRGTSVTVANTVSTYLADRWYVKNSLGTNGIITYSQQAGSVTGSKYGAKVQITTAPTALHTNGTELYQVIENMNTLPLLDKIMSARMYIKAFGNVNQVGIQFYYKTTEAKVDTALGTEALVTVNASTFTLGQLLGQAINNLPTSAGVLGIRIRITGVSSGNTYDLNNGFIVEQAMMNVGISSLPFKRRGDSIREELHDCQRYYEKSYNLSNPPGNPVDGLGVVSAVSNSAIASPAFVVTVRFQSDKRDNPTVTYYNHSTGATGSWRDNGGADVTVGSMAGTVGTTGIVIVPTAASVNGRVFVGHFTAESEI